MRNISRFAQCKRLGSRIRIVQKKKAQKGKKRKICENITAKLAQAKRRREEEDVVEESIMPNL